MFTGYLRMKSERFALKKKQKTINLTCVVNIKGCHVPLKGGVSRQTIPIISDNNRYSLWYIHVYKSCLINQDLSYFRTCNGSWQKIGSVMWHRFWLEVHFHDSWYKEIKIWVSLER